MCRTCRCRDDEDVAAVTSNLDRSTARRALIGLGEPGFGQVSSRVGPIRAQWRRLTTVMVRAFCARVVAGQRHAGTSPGLQADSSAAWPSTRALSGRLGLPPKGARQVPQVTCPLEVPTGIRIVSVGVHTPGQGDEVDTAASLARVCRTAHGVIPVGVPPRRPGTRSAGRPRGPGPVHLRQARGCTSGSVSGDGWGGRCWSGPHLPRRRCAPCEPPRRPARRAAHCPW